MREILAAVIIGLIVGFLFWPETMGTSYGEKAGKFMRGFNAAYHKNVVVD